MIRLIILAIVLSTLSGSLGAGLAACRNWTMGPPADTHAASAASPDPAGVRETPPSDTDRLWVDECYANQGPSLKRIRAAPMGRAFRITKRTSHLTVSVREEPEAVTAVAGGEPEEETAGSPAGRAPAARNRPRRRRGRSGN